MGAWCERGISEKDHGECRIGGLPDLGASKRQEGPSPHVSDLQPNIGYVDQNQEELRHVLPAADAALSWRRLKDDKERVEHAGRHHHHVPSDVGLHEAAVQLPLVAGLVVRCEPIVKAALSCVFHVVGCKLHCDLELLILDGEHGIAVCAPPG